MFRRVSRDLASLGTNAHEQRYKKSSQKRGSYTFVHSSASAPLTKPIDPPTTPIARPTPDATSVPLTHREDDSRLTGSAAADQRTAIKYFYENVLGSPPAHTWKAEGTITIILHHLCMPPGSWGTVRKVLLALVSDPESDVRAEAPGKGRGALIEEPSEQADVIYALLEAGNSVATVTYLLNQGYRASRGLDHICYSAVDRFVRSSPVIHRARRHMKKSGKDDAGTPWAAARLAFSLQLLEQLAGTGSRWPSLHLHAIVWWDEHHKKVILGHTSVHEYRVRRDSAGKPAPAAAGGGAAASQAKHVHEVPWRSPRAFRRCQSAESGWQLRRREGGAFQLHWHAGRRHRAVQAGVRGRETSSCQPPSTTPYLHRCRAHRKDAFSKAHLHHGAD